MKLDNYLDRKIGEALLAENEERENGHKSSGKLSASMLGWPLQWQILKSLGVPQSKKDEYTLRKFKRGNHVEDWLIEHLNPIEKQAFVEYRGCIGYADAIVDTKDWDFQVGTIPLEIKSTTNLKFKKIVKQGADRSHKLQAGLYALSKGSEQFGVTYVASDDYRVQTFIYETKDVKDEIDQIISRYESQMKIGIPVFEAAEDWQANKLYNNYPEWSELTQEEVNKKYEEIKQKNGN